LSIIVFNSIWFFICVIISAVLIANEDDNLMFK
jgi:hypothetical protein